MANDTPPSSPVQPEIASDLERPDERSVLMQRARMMGIKFSNNIGLEALKAKITAHMEGEREQDEAQAEEVPPHQVLDSKSPAAPPQMRAEVPVKPLTPQEERQELIKEATKLVRLRITCLDPKKKDLPGEIFTVANKFIGTVRKFVPFGEATDNGYHVPHCIYEMLRDRKFLHTRTVGKHDKARVVTSYEREFALEVLPPLTRKDLQRLAVTQAAKAGADQ